MQACKESRARKREIREMGRVMEVVGIIQVYGRYRGYSCSVDEMEENARKCVGELAKWVKRKTLEYN